MKKFTIKEIAKAIGGNIVQGDADQIVDSVSTDTRTIQHGDLFFALIGENHDGHSYVLKAAEAGATALVLSKKVSNLPDDITVVMVPNTLKALQNLARHNRNQFDIPVIGITGSNGKTTTKDLVSSLLCQKYRVLKTIGNFNNEIGLPLTLLKLNKEYDVAVVEMGMRGLGQIDQLCSIAGITAGIITNIGETHLEILGSVENIAKAKGEILKHIPKSGFALIPANNKLAKEQASQCLGEVISFGINQGDFTACDLSINEQNSSFVAFTPAGKMKMVLPIPGRHNISNAMAAVAVGVKLGMTLRQCADGLKRVEISAMRLQVLNIGQLTIINDAYNANPDSTRAALATLKDLAGKRRRVAILGSMFELGNREQKGHYEAGAAAADVVELLLAVGELAKGIAQGAKDAGMPSERVHWFSNNKSACNYLKQNLEPDDVLLVKGSRGMQMEEIVQYINQESGLNIEL